MKANMRSGSGIVALALLGLLACGCETTPSGEQPQTPAYGPWDAGRAPAAAAPAPAPAPTRAAPAAQPSASNVMYLPTGDRSTSALMIEKVMPAEAIVGQPFTYKIIATNLTNMALDDVRVTDNVQGMTIRSADPAGKAEGNIMSWNLGSLAGRAQKVITVTAAASAAGQASSCCGATWTNALCAGVNVVQPALRVAKTITPEALVCDTIAMRIEVTNTGTGIARNVRVRDTLPAGLTTADGKTSLEMDAGTLAAGQTRAFTANLKASKTGKYDNKATATADGNLTAESAPVSVTVRQPALEIKAECAADILIGRNATVKFTVSNKGDAACKGTTVSAPVPGGSAFVSADSGGAATGTNVTWNLGDLAAGASKTVSMTLRVSAAGDINASATANCTCSSPATDRCSFKAAGSPDIGAQLIDADGVVIVGDNHTYTYEVVNQGQVNLTNVKTVVTLPAELDYVSSTAQPGPQVAGKKLEFAVGTLAPKGRKTFTFTVKANKAGEVSVLSETTCAELRNATRDDEITNFVAR